MADDIPGICTRADGHLPPCNGLARISSVDGKDVTCWRPYTFTDVIGSVADLPPALRVVLPDDPVCDCSRQDGLHEHTCRLVRPTEEENRKAEAFFAVCDCPEDQLPSHRASLLRAENERLKAEVKRLNRKLGRGDKDDW
jgi:hypothetical protein